MSENKRFRKGKSILTDFPTGAIIDEETGERYYDGIKPSYISSKELVELLNGLYEENEYLKQVYTQLKHRHSLLHDVCLDVECERDSLKKDVESLEKENKELKEELLEAIDDLSEKRPNKKGFAGNGRFA